MNTCLLLGVIFFVSEGTWLDSSFGSCLEGVTAGRASIDGKDDGLLDESGMRGFSFLGRGGMTDSSGGVSFGLLGDELGLSESSFAAGVDSMLGLTGFSYGDEWVC